MNERSTNGPGEDSACNLSAAPKGAESAFSPDPATPDRRANRRIVLATAVLVSATLAVYCNSFHGPFIFDDDASIPSNPTIRQLRTSLSPPNVGGITVNGRPVLNLSLAINYAFCGLDVRGYHLMNLAIHVLAGLVLFGIVRRTLLLPAMRGAMLPAAEACRATVGQPSHASADGSMAPATYLAGAVALLWLVHPLQTESVTYIVQRAESLMGLFYLLTLYCLIRSCWSRAVLWPLAAVAACAMGMATKEMMVTAPLIVLLYDRTFLAGSFTQALRKRWDLYLSLAACWALLAYLMVHTGDRGNTAGFGAAGVPPWWLYARTQCWVILNYLCLTLWPRGLCLDYGPQFSPTLWQFVLGALTVGSIALATLWGLLRGKPWAFLGACFLAILAPTSSIVPIRDPIFEHRMYLPLAAVLAALVLGAAGLWKKLSPQPNGGAEKPSAWRWIVPSAVLAAAAVSLGSLTLLRNYDYRSLAAILQATFKEAPTNARACSHLGRVLAAEPGELPHAMELLHKAVGLDPTYADAYSNLGAALLQQGKADEAVPNYRHALELTPDDAQTLGDLAAALFQQGKIDEAAACCRRALELAPNYAQAHNVLGATLIQQDKTDEAIGHLREAIRLNPQMREAYINLAVALEKAGRHEEANQALNQAKNLESSEEPQP